MPNRDHSIEFWREVATYFKDMPDVIFDLHNEPYPDRTGGTLDEAWTCWRDGGWCTGINYEVAGMQDLINAVRSTGAGNVIMLGGLAYSNDIS